MQDFVKSEVFPTGVYTDDVESTEVFERKQTFAGACRIVCFVNICPAGEFAIGLAFVVAYELRSYVCWKIGDVVLKG